MTVQAWIDWGRLETPMTGLSGADTQVQPQPQFPNAKVR